MTRMAWTAEDRRKYAPAIQEVLRQGMIVRLVRTMDALDPQPKVGRERVWSTLIMLQALWHLARDGCAWRRLPAAFPPFTTVWCRLRRWRELAVLDRALAMLVACLRLARGRKRRPTAAIIGTRSTSTGRCSPSPPTSPPTRRRGRPGSTAASPGRSPRRSSTATASPSRWSGSGTVKAFGREAALGGGADLRLP